MFSGKMKSFLALSGGLFLAAFAANTSAQAGFIAPTISAVEIKATAQPLDPQHTQMPAPVWKVKNFYKNNNSVNRSDGINKYNPNAAAIGQMLGGAKSLDLGGVGAGYSSRHVAYCSIRYGSYKTRDNTFLSFSGERKQCRSPYMNIEN